MSFEIKHQVFGSPSYIDLDVCFFVGKIGSIQENKSKLKLLESTFKNETNKRVNGNLCVVKNGVVFSCFKGTIDELNNSLYVTCVLHSQLCNCQVIKVVIRDVEIKIQRCLRTVISLFTRTSFRAKSKAALRGGLIDKIQFLKELNFSSFDESFGKNGSELEVYKSIAFQIGQTTALIKTKELYTKEEIMEELPHLSNYLLRNKEGLLALEKAKNDLISLILAR